MRAAIESVHSDDVDAGFRNQAINSRGVHVRGFLEGGGQERELVAKYRAHAEAFHEWWAPRYDHEAEPKEDEP